MYMGAKKAKPIRLTMTEKEILEIAIALEEGQVKDKLIGKLLQNGLAFQTIYMNVYGDSQ